MKKIWILCMCIMVVALAGCQSQDVAKVEPVSETQQEVEVEPVVEAQDMTLSIGLMPAVDTAPILLADKLGYYEEEGVDVSIEIYSNAQDRQSALQTNLIDGAMTDLVAVATNVNGGFDIKATMTTDGMFPILANKESIEKESITVGMMEVSVSNFLVDEWLSPDYTIEKVYVNAIPARLEAVASKQLDMGLFPEPVATIGVMKGLEKLVFEPTDENFPDVMVFTGQAINEKSEAVKAFHKAYNRAVEEIQKDEMAARDVLVERIPNIKPEVKDIMLLPTYKMARLPDEAYIQKIIDWTNEVLELELSVEASDLVDSAFVE